jgi:threonine synthase
MPSPLKAAGPGRLLVCRDCGERSEPDPVRWRCSCGGLLDIVPAPVEFDPSRITVRPPTMWRYAEALPLAGKPATSGIVSDLSMGEGMTPLVGHRVGRVEVLLKLEFLMPTLSFKDRGAVMLVGEAVSVGARELVADSSGNAGTAISAYAARAGLPCTVYVRSGTKPRKLAQMRAHGARVVEIAGTREDVAAAAIEAVEVSRAFYASHVYNPFFVEGTKTFGLEVWEQLRWTAPATLVLPVGNGTLVLGAARAFEELLAAGAIDRLPRLVAVQAAGCAPIATAFRNGADTVTAVVSDGTIADGIEIGAPARGDQILDAVRRFDGLVVEVDDETIAGTAEQLCGRGIFIEPTAAAPLAAVATLPTALLDAGPIVVPLTGAGLKAA